MSLRSGSGERRRGRQPRPAAALAVLVVVASLAALPAVGTAQEGTDPTTFVIQQGDTCTQVQPLGDGTESVEEFYDYRTFNDTPGAQLPANYSSLGTVDLQMNQVSQVFVYDGSQGLSLVFLHDRINEPNGFVATADVSGLPADGQPVVEDDDYANRDDVFEYTDTDDARTSAHIEWVSNGERTDGWAYRGLGSAQYSSITVEMAFNEESSRYPFAEAWNQPYSDHRIERFVARSGTGDATELAMSQPLTIGPGTCAGGIVPNTPSSGPAPGTPAVTTAAPSPSGSTPDSGETPFVTPTTTSTPTATATPTTTTTSTSAPTATPLPDSTAEEPAAVTTTSVSDGEPVAGTPTDDANAGDGTGDGTGGTGRVDDGTTTDSDEGGSGITGDGFGIALAVAAIVALVAAVALSRHDR